MGWQDRAKAGTLPATDRTGAVRVNVGPIEARENARADALDIYGDRLTVGPSRQSWTVADLQRAMRADDIR